MTERYNPVMVCSNDRSWEAALLNGMKYKITFNLVRRREASTVDYFSNGESQYHREGEYKRIREELKELLGPARGAWRCTSWKPEMRQLVIYTKDVSWLVVAKLTDHHQLVESVLSVEQHEQATCE